MAEAKSTPKPEGKLIDFKRTTMERTILVSYDLFSPGKDYSKLYEYLRSYVTRAKPLESVWLIKTTLSTGEIRDTIQAYYIDKNDKLLVIDVTGKSTAWLNLGDAVSQWIKNNL